MAGTTGHVQQVRGETGSLRLCCQTRTGSRQRHSRESCALTHAAAAAPCAFPPPPSAAAAAAAATTKTTSRWAGTHWCTVPHRQRGALLKRWRARPTLRPRCVGRSTQGPSHGQAVSAHTEGQESLHAMRHVRGDGCRVPCALHCLRPCPAQYRCCMVGAAAPPAGGPQHAMHSQISDDVFRSTCCDRAGSWAGDALDCCFFSRRPSQAQCPPCLTPSRRPRGPPAAVQVCTQYEARAALAPLKLTAQCMTPLGRMLTACAIGAPTPV